MFRSSPAHLRRTILVVVAALSPVALGGCEAKGTGASSASSREGKKGRSAEDRRTPSLKQVVERFKDYETCLSRLSAEVPPELGVDLLSYYDLPDGVCRTRQALAKKKPELCHRALTYALQKGCRTMYAIYHAKPDACPHGRDLRRGRDGYCLAIATRSIALCRSARRPEQRVRCRAVLAQKPAACRKLSRPARRRRCEAEVRRYEGMVEAKKGRLPAGFEPSLALELARPDGSHRGLPFRRVVLHCADFGVVVPSRGRTAQIDVCTGEPYGLRRSSATDGSDGVSAARRRTSIQLSLRPPAEKGDAIPFGVDALLVVDIRGFGAFRSVGGKLQLTRFERRRGAVLAGRFAAKLRGRRGRLAIQGKLRTFVRDLLVPVELEHRRFGGGAAGRRARWRRLHSADRSFGGGAAEAGGRDRARRYAALTTSASVTPVSIGGRSGFRVSSIRPGSIWKLLGVREGDVVFRVGSVRLVDEGALAHVREELRRAHRIAIRLRRGRRGRTLRLGPVRLRRLHQRFYF